MGGFVFHRFLVAWVVGCDPQRLAHLFSWIGGVGFSQILDSFFRLTKLATCLQHGPNVFGVSMETETQPALVAELAKRLAEQLERTRPAPPRVAYTLDETATMLGVSKRVVEGLVNTGQLPAKRAGRCLIVTHRAIERWLYG